MAFYIFTFSFFRNWMYDIAIENQPSFALTEEQLLALRCIAFPLYVFGVVFVISSSWALGIVGTYNGDYFGILMEKRLTQFPFNVLNNPMYVGSTLIFLAHALWRASPAGILLSAWVWIVYKTFCVLFEEPFTGQIYAEAERLRRKASKRKQTAPGSPMLHPDDVKLLSSFTTAEVVEWLGGIGLAQYATNFTSNHVDGEVLLSLNDASLREDIGIASLGHRFKVLKAVKQRLGEEKKLQHFEMKLNKWTGEREAIERAISETADLKVLSKLKEQVVSRINKLAATTAM
eukprot:CAMPEP_0177663492 /NCGR_PEP_ID=MMETSP0447-20121125/19944_1 /TAXON_ID=0 /ORGANISM="Stygamoeba regulata, Strain BSH-02190019" /LENGTH=288 /DNA_ID=CAMNT_0019169311 /DNA_START=201 /DNA_END=1067 /DNA_ORIENTATION=-